MSCRGTVRALGAMILLAVLWGCDVYNPQLLQAGVQSADSGMGEPYVVRCGNGRRDDDEQCDTAIAAGEVGACPSECPSDDPCVPHALAGDDCQKTCVPLPIDYASNDDGCCPLGIDRSEDSDCSVCGDGVIGPNETCEPPSNCVTETECASVAACLRGVFSGDPAQCTSRCRLELIKDCQDDDGCCPPSCTAANDNDCSATCGNGIVETQNHETCEASSVSSPCPTSCDDGIACTTDITSGTAQQCNLTCSHVAVTAVSSDDGCCPSGATSLTDDDCLPVCGNQLVEQGETCDPCPASCDDANACTTDTRSGSGCGVVCGHATITATQAGDGCCPAGANANTDSDCPVVCGNGVTETGEECDGGGRCNVSCKLVLPSSLVHRYSFDGTGTTAIDSMGTANGTVVNTTLSGNGLLSVAGGSSDQYLKLPSGIISALTDMTVEVWTTWQGGSNSHHIFDFGMNDAGGGSNTGVGTEYFYLNPHYSTDQLMFGANFTPAGNDYATADFQIFQNALSTGTRHHLVVTFHDPGSSSSKTAIVYVDGAQVGSTSVSATSSGTPNRLRNLDDQNVWVGRSNYSTATYAGSVEEFRIYNAALSASAVTANFNAGPNP